MTGEHRRLTGGLSLPQTALVTHAVEGHTALGWRRPMGGRIHGRQERTCIAEGAGLRHCSYRDWMKLMLGVSAHDFSITQKDLGRAVVPYNKRVRAYACNQTRLKRGMRRYGSPQR